MTGPETTTQGQAADGITVRVESFVGPLDLLLHLCRTNEMDLSRLSLRTITDQYLAHLEAVRFRDCTMKGNGGAGIGVVLDEGGTSTIDGLVIDGCYLAGNGASGATGVLKGAVELRGGNGSHAVFISNSSLKSSVRGSGVDRDAHGFAPKVIVSGCDLRFNSGGAASASGYVDGGGNVTA